MGYRKKFTLCINPPFHRGLVCLNSAITTAESGTMDNVAEIRPKRFKVRGLIHSTVEETIAESCGAAISLIQRASRTATLLAAPGPVQHRAIVQPPAKIQRLMSFSPAQSISAVKCLPQISRPLSLQRVSEIVHRSPKGQRHGVSL